MSDDEDELQELRAALRAREGLSASALRARELIDKQHASSSYFLDPKHNPMQRRANEEEEEEEEREGEDEAEQMHDGLRSHFPMSFGLPEKKGGNILEMHDTFKRGAGPSIGPPRPPRPRPPRQPMPPPSSNWTSAREGEGDRQREDEEEEGEEEGNLVGPLAPLPVARPRARARTRTRTRTRTRVKIRVMGRTPGCYQSPMRYLSEVIIGQSQP